MSTQGGDIEFTFRGNAAQLMSELKKIDGSIQNTAAKAAPSVGKVKSVLDATRIATEKFNKSANTLDSTASKLGGSANKLAGILSLVNPEAANVARSIGDVADVGEVAAVASRGFGVSLGGLAAAAAPVLVVAAALAVAWNHYAEELAEAEAAQASMAAMAARAVDAHQALETIESELEVAVRKGTGTNVEAQMALERRVAAIDAAIDAEVRQLAVIDDSGRAGEMYDALEEKRHRLTQAAGAAYTAEIKVAAGTDAAGAAAKRAEDATRALTDAMQEQNDIATGNASSYFGIIDEMQAAEDKASESQLDAVRKLKAARKRDLEELDRTYQRGLALTKENTSAREELDRQAGESRRAIIDANEAEIAEVYTKWRKQASDEAIAIAEKQAEREQALQDATTSAFRGAIDSMLSLIGDYAAESEDVQKGLALTSIAISTAEGIMKAFGQFGWPAGLGPAAAVTAQGIIEGAAVLKAHQGSGGAPDEATVTLRDEAVLNTQTTRALGDRGVMDLNGNGGRGASGGGVGGPTVMELRVGRAVQREMVRSATLPGGSIEQMIREASTRTGIDTGFSGNVSPP